MLPSWIFCCLWALFGAFIHGLLTGRPCRQTFYSITGGRHVSSGLHRRSSITSIDGRTWINGVEYTTRASGGSISLNGDVLRIDGEIVPFGGGGSAGGRNFVVNVRIEGMVGKLACSGDAVVTGDVLGDVTAGYDVTCANVSGNVSAGTDVTASGSVMGDVSAGTDVTVGGTIEGGVSAGTDVQVKMGDIHGNVTAGTDVNAGGHIRGSVSAGTDIKCCANISHHRSHR